jgi:DNA-directed RNA polymerase subunit RPC12/RpoP
MRSSTTVKWVEAAKILAEDVTATVRCPERDDGRLIVSDQVFAAEPTMMERTLRCEQCGARNVIRMRAMRS